MDVIQSLALIALLSMLIYLVFVNVFKGNTLKSSGTVSTFVSTPPVPLALTVPPPAMVNEATNEPAKPDLITNKLPAQVKMDASMQPGTSIFNPNTTGILPQNQDIFEKQADFGSDVTNINQFYKNNPEVFSRLLGQNDVTNVAEWELNSKKMYSALQQAPSGPIQAANFEDPRFGPPRSSDELH